MGLFQKIYLDLLFEDYQTAKKNWSSFSSQPLDQTRVVNAINRFKQIQANLPQGQKTIEDWQDKPFEEFEEFVTSYRSRKDVKTQKGQRGHEVGSAQFVDCPEIQALGYDLIFIPDYQSCQFYQREFRGKSATWCIGTSNPQYFFQSYRKSIFFFLIKNRDQFEVNDEFAKVAAQVKSNNYIVYWSMSDKSDLFQSDPAYDSVNQALTSMKLFTRFEEESKKFRPNFKDDQQIIQWLKTTDQSIQRAVVQSFSHDMVKLVFNSLSSLDEETARKAANLFTLKASKIKEPSFLDILFYFKGCLSISPNREGRARIAKDFVKIFAKAVTVIKEEDQDRVFLDFNEQIGSNIKDALEDTLDQVQQVDQDSARKIQRSFDIVSSDQHEQIARHIVSPISDYYHDFDAVAAAPSIFISSLKDSSKDEVFAKTIRLMLDQRFPLDDVLEAVNVSEENWMIDFSSDGFMESALGDPKELKERLDRLKRLNLFTESDDQSKVQKIVKIYSYPWLAIAYADLLSEKMLREVPSIIFCGMLCYDTSLATKRNLKTLNYSNLVQAVIVNPALAKLMKPTTLDAYCWLCILTEHPKCVNDAPYRLRCDESCQTKFKSAGQVLNYYLQSLLFGTTETFLECIAQVESNLRGNHQKSFIQKIQIWPFIESKIHDCSLDEEQWRKISPFLSQQENEKIQKHFDRCHSKEQSIESVQKFYACLDKDAFSQMRRKMLRGQIPINESAYEDLSAFEPAKKLTQINSSMLLLTVFSKICEDIGYKSFTTFSYMFKNRNSQKILEIMKRCKVNDDQLVMKYIQAVSDRGLIDCCFCKDGSLWSAGTLKDELKEQFQGQREVAEQLESIQYDDVAKVLEERLSSGLQQMISRDFVKLSDYELELYCWLADPKLSARTASNQNASILRYFINFDGQTPKMIDASNPKYRDAFVKIFGQQLHLDQTQLKTTSENQITESKSIAPHIKMYVNSLIRL